jgi:hypothetical protein
VRLPEEVTGRRDEVSRGERLILASELTGKVTLESSDEIYEVAPVND